SSAPITIRLASEAGHSGTAVLFGGRGAPLPYCPPTGYSFAPGDGLGLYVGGPQYVTIDGGNRGGSMIYGAKQGVRFGSDAAAFITLRNMELFDNGIATQPFSNGGWNSDEEGVSLHGHDLTFERLIVHDNGQDEFQDETHGTGTLNNL